MVGLQNHSWSFTEEWPLLYHGSGPQSRIEWDARSCCPVKWHLLTQVTCGRRRTLEMALRAPRSQVRSGGPLRSGKEDAEPTDQIHVSWGAVPRYGEQVIFSSCCLSAQESLLGYHTDSTTPARRAGAGPTSTLSRLGVATTVRSWGRWWPTSPDIGF